MWDAALFCGVYCSGQIRRFLALPPLSILPLPPIPLNTCALNPYSKGQVAIVLFVCSATGWVLASVKGFCREPTCYCPVAVLTLDP